MGHPSVGETHAAPRRSVARQCSVLLAIGRFPQAGDVAKKASVQMFKRGDTNEKDRRRHH
jgi:hypothetical protein